MNASSNLAFSCGNYIIWGIISNKCFDHFSVSGQASGVLGTLSFHSGFRVYLAGSFNYSDMIQSAATSWIQFTSHSLLKTRSNWSMLIVSEGYNFFDTIWTTIPFSNFICCVLSFPKTRPVSLVWRQTLRLYHLLAVRGCSLRSSNMVSSISEISRRIYIGGGLVVSWAFVLYSSYGGSNVFVTRELLYSPSWCASVLFGAYIRVPVHLVRASHVYGFYLSKLVAGFFMPLSSWKFNLWIPTMSYLLSSVSRTSSEEKFIFTSF